MNVNKFVQCINKFYGLKGINLLKITVDPIINNPIESMDLDNGITLCKFCHKEVHKISGCKYSELRC
jgi:hypothetical protein